MTEKTTIVLKTSGAVTATGNSREFPDFANYDNAVFYVQVTAFTGTSLDLILRAYNPRHVNDGTNTPQFNIMNETEWIDGNGTAITLTSTAEGNALRFTATGKARGRLKTGYELADVRLDLRWLFTGTTTTFDALAIAEGPE